MRLLLPTAAYSRQAPMNQVDNGYSQGKPLQAIYDGTRETVLMNSSTRAQPTYRLSLRLMSG